MILKSCILWLWNSLWIFVNVNCFPLEKLKMMMGFFFYIWLENYTDRLNVQACHRVCQGKNSRQGRIQRAIAMPNANKRIKLKWEQKKMLYACFLVESTPLTHMTSVLLRLSFHGAGSYTRGSNYSIDNSAHACHLYRKFFSKLSIVHFSSNKSTYFWGFLYLHCSFVVFCGKKFYSFVRYTNIYGLSQGSFIQSEWMVTYNV